MKHTLFLSRKLPWYFRVELDLSGYELLAAIMTCHWNRFQCSEYAKTAREFSKKELVLHSYFETETCFYIKKSFLCSESRRSPELVSSAEFK